MGGSNSIENTVQQVNDSIERTLFGKRELALSEEESAAHVEASKKSCSSRPVEAVEDYFGPAFTVRSCVNAKEFVVDLVSITEPFKSVCIVCAWQNMWICDEDFCANYAPAFGRVAASRFERYIRLPAIRKMDARFRLKIECIDCGALLLPDTSQRPMNQLLPPCIHCNNSQEYANIKHFKLIGMDFRLVDQKSRDDDS